MRKWFLVMMLVSMAARAEIVVDRIEFQLPSWSWQMVAYSRGAFSSSTGYSKLVNGLNGKLLTITTSNRYIESKDADAFYQSLMPLERKLIPYMGSKWGANSYLNLLSDEPTIVGGHHAKKLTFQVIHLEQPTEISVVYLIPTEVFGYFSTSVLGHTIAFTCTKMNYAEKSQEIEHIIAATTIR